MNDPKLMHSYLEVSYTVPNLFESVLISLRLFSLNNPKLWFYLNVVLLTAASTNPTSEQSETIIDVSQSVLS